MGTVPDPVIHEYEHWGTILDVPGFIKHVKEKLQKKNFTPNTSRLVLSVCPDDVNRLPERETIEGALVGVYGGEFHLGSLAGYPLTGVTGIIAASHHAPDVHVESACVEGNLIFFVSAHLGLMEGPEPIFGRMMRPGQDHETKSCGAMMGFIQWLRKNGIPSKPLEDESHIDWARIVLFNELISRHGDEIARIMSNENGSESQQAVDLSKVNYTLIHSKLVEMIEAFHQVEPCEAGIAIIGGITVNLPRKDYFILKDFEIPNR